MTGLDKLQRDVLASFFGREKRFFLTGGAALVGFHLHHRRTLDLDLFTTGEHLDEGESSLQDSAREIGARVERLRISPTFRRFLLRRGSESVVVDVAMDLSPQIDEEKQLVGEIAVDTPREIMANKLCTLLSRAELRDLVDVHALENAGYSLEDHLHLAMKKDSGLTPAQLAWVLSEIEIGDDATPPGNITVEELRAYLEDLRHRLTGLAFPGA